MKLFTLLQSVENDNFTGSVHFYLWPLRIRVLNILREILKLKKMQIEVVKGTIFIFIYGSFCVWCVRGSNGGRFGKVKIQLISSFLFADHI